MNESEFVAALRSLPLHPGARDLRDDAAVLTTASPLVISTDTLVEGIHFLPADPPQDVAWKLVAANLSDLAAKGAIPVGVLLNYPLTQSASPAQAGAQLRDADEEPRRCVIPAIATGPRPAPGKRVEENWDAAFLTGLAQALTHFAAPLLGGDTVSLPLGAPRILTLTAIGDGSDAPARSGARAGDALWVTGTIGDAGAGLEIARGALGPAELLAAYRRPQPRLAEGAALAPLVHAMMDVSDGLLIDAQRMGAASGLAVAIDIAAVPLSRGYRAFAGDGRAARIAAATAGDDYQLLFAGSPDAHWPVAATCIGRFAQGAGLTLRDGNEPVALPARLGYEHAV